MAKMELSEFQQFLLFSLGLLSSFFILFIGCALIAVIVLYIIDKTQHEHAIRHNYPVIGRFRYLFEEWGVFFRQYFFAFDREEMPFNRAERSWVYRASKNVDRTIGFGSTRKLTEVGTVIFVNVPFPTISQNVVKPKYTVLGPYCRHPYRTAQFFHISAMSFGALSKPAIQALSKGAQMCGCWLNTGEGGLSPYHLEGGADLIFQIGTAKYGVRTEFGELSDERLKEIASYEQVKMFELKLSQGAKPGKGGLLPGKKVTAEVSRIRGIPVGKDSLSPNSHLDIKTVAELLDMLARIREVTGKPVGFKAVLGTTEWLDDLFNEIKIRGQESAPDFITLDGADGGTGAAPQSLMDYMGLTLQDSLPILIQKLEVHDLRARIKVICSGKLITPSHVAWALAMGADFIQTARGFMFALGCIQALKCHQDTCPTGITTHQKRLQAGLDPRSKCARVANYQKYITYDVGMIAHACGVTEPRELQKQHVRIVNEKGVAVSVGS